MSDHSHVLHPPAPENFDRKHAGGLPMILLAAGVVGILGSMVGLLVPRWHAQFAHSYLFAFAYFFTLCLGALFWTCLHHATDADWSVVVRRQLENIASLIPFLALLFIPLLFVAKHVWHWWDVAHGEDALLDAKQPYLSQWFFYTRLAVYFILLTWVAWSLKRRSTKQDADGAARHSLVMRKFGVGGIPVVGICITFAAFDWLMGLDYHWFSTMWGVYIFAGAAGASMSLLVLIVTVLKSRGYLNVVTLEHYHIMGKFMLAFTIFWAYIGYSQYMLIWYANIPEETVYFQIRNTNSWVYFSTFLVIGRFFLPFPVLLLQWTKKNPKYLCMVAGWILFMQFIDLYVVVLPALHKNGFSPSLFDLLAFVGIGGILGWLFLRKLGSSPLFPVRDPRLAASMQITN
jgi:hypothetical protein